MKTRGETMRAAADIQSAGQNAFGSHAAFNASAHRLPDALDAVANDLDGGFVRIVRGGFHQRAFVLKHELADGEFIGMSCCKQLRCAVKRERNGCLLHLCGGIDAIFRNEAAAD